MTLTLRDPNEVMRLKRLGSTFPTRLSFQRVLLRRLAAEGSTVSRPVWEIDDEGFGRAVYSVDLGGYTYSLVAFSNPLDPENRTDRVIANAWDTTYVLFDGTPSTADLDRLQQNAPKQEAGRYEPTEIVLCRANKSVRLFAHVVDALKAGKQPDPALITSTGYLMRTTAVYGNGKFGIADRARIADRPGLGGPFMAEMLAVWLVRGFTHDLAEHMGGAEMSRELKKRLGIGNSTGLGMAPFLVSHPVLLHHWFETREIALARVVDVSQLSDEHAHTYADLCVRAHEHLQQWHVPDPVHQTRNEAVATGWADLTQDWTVEAWKAPNAPQHFLEASTRYNEDIQELAVSLLLEPMGDLIDDLAADLASDNPLSFDPAMDVADLRHLIETQAAWALDTDFDAAAETAQFWYVSQSKLEPRLGNRAKEDGAELESPLDIARRIKDLYADLQDAAGSVAGFLMRRPEHRFALRRVQTLGEKTYSELRDNLISDRCMPIDMLRAKLACFGASKFDPKSDRWTRINLCQGAPLFDELDNADDWWLPVFEEHV